ncbi:MAG: hypothetical protein DRP47_01910 [Candidatus Zixiibacteriota bacterium]|nr:MAG: hypothetical protein DRP47_01910 [candidate division Zixibacteria bacterium]
MSHVRLISLALCLIIVFSALGCSSNYRLSRDIVNQPSVRPSHRSDTQATGGSVDGAFPGELDIIWEQRVSGKPAGPLSLSKGTLVYPSARRRIKFFDVLSGKNLGKLKCKGSPQSGVVIHDSLAFFGVSPNRNKLYCINLYNGKTVWQAHVKDAPARPIILNSQLLVSSRAGVLTAYDLETGEQNWTFHTDGRLIASVAGCRDMLYQGDDAGNLYALSVDDGALQFRVALDGPIVSTPILSDLLIMTDVVGNVYGINIDNGHQVWKKELGSSIWAPPAVSGNSVFIGLSGGYLVSLDAMTGVEQWRFQTEDVIRAAPVAVGQYVLVGTLTGMLYSLSVADGKLIEQRQLTGAIRFGPVSDGDRVYIATESGMIICCGERNE